MCCREAHLPHPHTDHPALLLPPSLPGWLADSPCLSVHQPCISVLCLVTDCSALYETISGALGRPGETNTMHLYLVKCSINKCNTALLKYSIPQEGALCFMLMVQDVSSLLVFLPSWTGKLSELSAQTLSSTGCLGHDALSQQQNSHQYTL